MLNDAAKINLQRIKRALENKWGDDCVIGPLKIIESPYPEFELPIYLYNKLEVGIYYDRSCLDIGIKQDGDEYIILTKFTDRPVLRGFESLEGNNLEYNFEVLDEVAHKLLNL